MKLFTVVSLAATFALMSCGGNYKNPEAAASSDSLVVNGNELSGTGKKVLDGALATVTEGASYALDFTLEDGGSLTLVSHGDETLAHGYEIRFARNGSGPGSLTVTLTANGVTRTTVNDAQLNVFQGFSAEQNLKFQIDVHADESPAHVLLWSRMVAEDFNRNSAIWNSGEEVDGSPGNGSHTRWGVILNRAKVTRADKSEPKLDH